MAALIPRLLTAHVLPVAELYAARLDGELVAVDEVWTCVDEPDDTELRARSIRLLIGRAPVLIACDQTAAWIWGALASPPRRVHLCTRRTERARSPAPPRVLCRERAVPDDDLVSVASLRVTSPLRTAADLLSVDGTRATIETVVRLLAGCRSSPDDLARMLERMSVRIARSGRAARLDEVGTAYRQGAAQPLLTR